MSETTGISLSTMSQYLSSKLKINIQQDPYQLEYVDAMIQPTSKVQAVFVDAEAGTGKTSLAISVGYKLLDNGIIDQIIYLRAPVAIAEMGFLPGDLAEKEAPYMQPGLDALSKVDEKNSRLIETLVSTNKLVISTTAFLRGVDWSGKKFVIIDEAQNLDLKEMQTVLTRAHDSVKLVVIGSHLQCDSKNNREPKKYGIEGLLPFELYGIHFEKYTPVPARNLKLYNNYRGRFSQYADKIDQTINYLNLAESERSEHRVKIGVDDEVTNRKWEELTENGISAYKKRATS